MGLFDKIKKAIDDSGVVDAAKAAVKSFTESTESKTIETPQKQIVEEKVAEKEVKETKPKAPPKPECEHGKCYVFAGKLCCNCADDVVCEKKESFSIDNRLEPELVDFYKAHDEYLNIKNKSTEAAEAKARAAATHFIRAYQPKLTFAKAYVASYIYKYGIDNERTRFVKNMQNVDLPSDHKQKLEFIWDKHFKEHIDLSSDWVCNTSLYKRNYREFQYTVSAFSKLSNSDWLESHILDTSVIDLKELYNEDGTIKDGGSYGGEGDTIYNIVERWCDGNENLETFAKEKEEREKAERERERKERAERLQQALATGNFRNY